MLHSGFINNFPSLIVFNLFLFCVGLCLAAPVVGQPGAAGSKFGESAGQAAAASGSGLSKLAKPTLAMSRWKKITGTALFINRLGKDKIYIFILSI